MVFILKSPFGVDRFRLPVPIGSPAMNKESRAGGYSLQAKSYNRCANPAEMPYCPKCEAELDSDDPAGLCPQCLIQGAFESSIGADESGNQTIYTEFSGSRD